MDQQQTFTRVAAIYDLHGNPAAFDAVLTEIALADVDLIVVGGDVALGPFPTAVIERLMTLDRPARFVQGNCDHEMVEHFDQLAADPDLQLDDPHGMVWSARQMTRAQRDFLATFQERVVIEIAGLGETHFCHGSPRNVDEILTRATPDDRLTAALDGLSASVIVCGHTHMQFDRAFGDRRVVNVGSVGSPHERQPGAYWALLGPDITLRRTTYAFTETAAMVRNSAFPNAAEFADKRVLHPPDPDEMTTLFEQLALKRGY